MIVKKTKLSNDYPRFCEICNRSFPTGKAMGGHMRSHLALAKIPFSRHRPTPLPLPPPPPPAHSRHPDPANPAAPSSSSSTTLSITNFPHRDLSPEEYSPTGGHPITRRRSKRKRRQSTVTTVIRQEIARSEEEEVAMCLLTLSKDPQLRNFIWKGKAVMADYNDDDDDEEEGGEENEYSFGKYRCETCKKGFRSYQALGGHRASHYKSAAKSLAAVDCGGEEAEEEGNYDDDDEDEDYLEEDEDQDQEVASASMVGGIGYNHLGNLAASVRAGGPVTSPGQVIGRKQFPCSFCGKVFESGQALGGHKKVHISYHHHLASPVMATPAKASSRMVNGPKPPVPPVPGKLVIDLNSAPMDDDG